MAPPTRRWTDTFVLANSLTPEGQRLQSRVTGLYYFEEVTSRRVQIAGVRESIGAVYPPNQVIYTNAFDSVEGDLVYTPTKAGMEQDIALTGNLPDPASLGFKSSDIKVAISPPGRSCKRSPSTPLARQGSRSPSP